MDEKQKHYFSEEGLKERVAKMRQRIAKMKEDEANMTDKEKMAKLKEQKKTQKKFITGLKKEHKSTISKMKKSCQTRTKKYNKDRKKLIDITFDLKQDKKELEACERNIESAIDRSKREVDEHERDLDIIIAKMHRFM